MAASSPGPMEQPAAVLVRLDPGGPVVADPGGPYLRADDLGVLRGDGVFERFLVRAGKPRHLEDHLSRRARSAAMMELTPPGRRTGRPPSLWPSKRGPAPESGPCAFVCTGGPEAGAAPTRAGCNGTRPSRPPTERQPLVPASSDGGVRRGAPWPRCPASARTCGQLRVRPRPFGTHRRRAGPPRRRCLRRCGP